MRFGTGILAITDWNEYYEQFRELVEEIGKRGLNSDRVDQLMECIDEGGRESQFNLDTLLPYYHLCVDLKELADSPLIRELIRISEIAGFPSLGEWRKIGLEDCFKIAVSWASQDALGIFDDVIENLEIRFPLEMSDEPRARYETSIRLVCIVRSGPLLIAKNPPHDLVVSEFARLSEMLEKK